MSDGPEIDRRNFLKAGATALASTTGLTAAGDVLSGEDDYDNILYGPHRDGSESYDPSELSEDLDGVFLENSADYLENPVAHLENLRSRPQYRDLIDEMAERDTAIYFGDIDLSTDARKAETGLMAGQTAMGAGLAAKAGLGEDFTRTDTALSGLAGWLMQPFAAYASFMGSGGDVDLVEASNSVHPESFAMTQGLRNAVVAYKQNELEGEYGAVWGSLHRGFEDRLEQSQESLKDDIANYSDIWQRFIGNEETVSKTVEMQSHNGNWYVEEIHESEDLEEIIE